MIREKENNRRGAAPAGFVDTPMRSIHRMIVLYVLYYTARDFHVFGMKMMRAIRATLLLLLCCGDAAAFTAPIRRRLLTSKHEAYTREVEGSRDEPNVSKIESIVANAKSLLPNDFSERKGNIASATVAGLAVSLAMVPEVVAFSFVAGVNPLVGLWTTVTLGFTAAALGGRAGICSSASGACSVVVAALGRSHSAKYLSACAMLAGVLQVFAGAIGLGRLIRLVPHPVMLGFVNGLAIVMTKAQLHHFHAPGGGFLSLKSAAGASMYGVTALTMALVKVFPKITKTVPATLGAVILSTIGTKLLKLPVKTLADVAGAETFKGGFSVLPKFALPSVPFSLDTLQVILPYAMAMAAVGCIESLLTMQLIDGMVDDGKRGSIKQECIGQGCGNLVSGLTGGIGGCAVLGQSIINVQSGGGVSKWSGMSMSLFLAAGIVAAAPLLGAVPVASLVGVMLLVCQSTFSWSSLRVLRKIPLLDVSVIALVSILTVQKNLALAFVAGTITSALGFALKQSTRVSAATRQDDDSKLYQLNGPIFFGSTRQFSSLFDAKADPPKIILDFSQSRVWDHSALQAIHSVAEQYGSQSKTVYLRHLSKDCTQLLRDLNEGGKLPPYEVIETDPSTDPVYGLAVDYKNVKL
jgi:SulP family sulfate permease